jgi:hypothetical protein
MVTALAVVAMVSSSAPRLAPAQARPLPTAALPVPVQLGATTSDDASAGALPTLTDAVLAAMPVAGMAALSDAPFSLELRIGSRSLGQSDAGMRIVVRSEVVAVLALRSASGVLGSARLVRAGSGRDLPSATAQAVSQLANDDAALRAALEEIGRQTAGAFDASCDVVLADAQRRANARAFDEAIALAMTVPAGATRCRARATSLAASLHRQHGQWMCGTTLQQASAAHAAGRLTEALDLLRFVDPLSPCQGEVSRLVAAIGRAADQRRATAEAARATELARQWAFRREALSAATSLERQRLIVLGQIAEAVLRPSASR